LNGKKKKIGRKDFIAAFNTLRLDQKQQDNIFKKMETAMPAWIDFIGISFLNNEFKRTMRDLIHKQFNRLQL
jgi:serine/threonine-protein kinase HipA